VTRPRLPVNSRVVSPGRRGGAIGEPAPSGSPSRTTAGQLVATIHQLIDSLTDLTDSDPLAGAASARSDLPLLLDAAEAAKLLSLSRAKVCAMASRGEIPLIRVGRALRIPSDQLLVWIKDRTAAASTSEGVRLPNWAHVDRSEEL
jgi:excisionase family DNA binding protein